jgi:hypothetical protein
MPVSTFALQAPIDVTAPIDNEPLKWYLHYASTFDNEGVQALAKTPNRFYNSKAINLAANGDVNNGSKAIFDDYIYLWGDFDHLTRDVRSITVVSDDLAGTHVFHMEVVTECHLKNGKGVVGVPTYFVYTGKKADPKETNEEYQFYQIRSYLDIAMVEKAKAQQ